VTRLPTTFEVTTVPETATTFQPSTEETATEQQTTFQSSVMFGEYIHNYLYIIYEPIYTSKKHENTIKTV